MRDFRTQRILWIWTHLRASLKMTCLMTCLKMIKILKVGKFTSHQEAISAHCESNRCCLAQPREQAEFPVLRIRLFGQPGSPFHAGFQPEKAPNPIDGKSDFRDQGKKINIAKTRGRKLCFLETVEARKVHPIPPVEKTKFTDCDSNLMTSLTQTRVH